jgi:light-harvesting complex 1 beta chain
MRSKEEVSMSEEKSVFSSVSDSDAKEINKWFVMGFMGFTAVAVIAHFLVWNWRPWFAA